MNTSLKTMIFNAGMIPNIKENLLNRQSPKRGRKRLCNDVTCITGVRGADLCVGGQVQAVTGVLSFERIQQLALRDEVMAYTVSNLWRFCRT